MKSARLTHGQENSVRMNIAQQTSSAAVLSGMAVGMSEGEVHLFRGPDEPVSRGFCDAPWHHSGDQLYAYILGLVDGVRCCDPCLTRHSLAVLAPSRYRKLPHAE